MKVIFLKILVLLIVSVQAQSPQSFKYQAVARDSSGNILTNQNIIIKISILQDSATGSAVYRETHNLTSNEIGFIRCNIGLGNVINGDLAIIDWANATYYTKVEIDTTDGSNYFELGTSQLLAVPYSLEAKHANSLILSDSLGNRYKISIDTSGNLLTTLIEEWTCGQPITDTRDGQIYNTVLIGTQCWMAENLNIGTKIDGINEQTDNSVIEKYCYGDDTLNCDTYGGLYQWNEMMQYVLDTGAQGICPPTGGWHLPSDEEWKILEGTVDSQYGVGDPEWDGTGYRGFDAGFHLKSTAGWYNNGNGDDSFGFTALPGGYRHSNGGFYYSGYRAYFWSSAEYSGSSAWRRILTYDYDEVYRHYYYETYGFSVRCLQD
ncbi:MAG: fibrobacter succinogenes major paralogous domain-containing protein [Bacteroidales bacterium]|nr:fibrobacter succinogenes major paralogous domain-containing protein [Bacteroidales bacterium]